jgi:hypothetical protein
MDLTGADKGDRMVAVRGAKQMTETPRIINTYDQNVADGGDRIIISFHAREPRAYMPARWVVWRVKNGKIEKTDPNGAWYNYGRKSFTCGSNKKERLAEAIAWVAEKYGAREFVRNRTGNYVEKEVNEKFPLPKKEKKNVLDK